MTLRLDPLTIWSCPVPAGAQTCNGLTGPYLSVKQGATNALAGDTLHIRSEHYNETLTISNRMTLQPYSGAVTIGKPRNKGIPFSRGPRR